MSKKDHATMRQELRGMRGDGERPDGDMGGRPGGMGRRPVGMGSRPGSDRPAGGAGFEKQEIWFTVVLAKK